MITDNIKIFTPAKINLFLKVLGRRYDGYHVIRSGITFVNIFDQIDIKINAQQTGNNSSMLRAEFFSTCTCLCSP